MDQRIQAIVERVEGLAGPLLVGEGFDLVEVQYRRERVGWVLRLFIDRAPTPEEGLAGRTGSGVTLDDCVEMSREVGRLLDVEDVVPGAYTLEVSSPGLDRPLTRPEHFRRFTGRKVKVQVTGPEGRSKVTGCLLGLAGGLIRLEADGREVTIPYEQAERVRLVPEVEWTRVS
ncbi:MAG: ribosome maturation factor RimP [Thermodesulfobacteriota bacterium]